MVFEVLESIPVLLASLIHADHGLDLRGTEGKRSPEVSRARCRTQEGGGGGELCGTSPWPRRRCGPSDTSACLWTSSSACSPSSEPADTDDTQSRLRRPASTCSRLRGGVTPHLYVGDSLLVGLEVVHALPQALPHQVAAATGLQLGDEALVGQPQLLSVVGRGHSGYHRLRDTHTHTHRVPHISNSRHFTHFIVIQRAIITFHEKFK